MAQGGVGTVTEALRLAARLVREDPRLAARQAREILRASPGNADAYRLLGAALRRTGEDREAERAELDAISASVRDPDLIRAAEALLDNDLAVAERILRPHLKRRPTDVAAIRMMAELAARLGRLTDAENLLRRALELGARRSRRRAPIWRPFFTVRTGRPRRSSSSIGCRPRKAAIRTSATSGPPCWDRPAAMRKRSPFTSRCWRVRPASPRSG